MVDGQQVVAQDTITRAPAPRVYLIILSLLAASFMVFQIAILRELRFQLNTIFTLAPFLFSSVLILIGLGSLSARRIKGSGHRVLRWCVTILPLLPLPLLAATVLIATVFSPLQPLAVSGDRYLNSVIVSFLLVAVFGYGAVFFLQGLIFALYFREGRQTGILSKVYATDLLASGAGALAGGILVFVLTPTQMVMVASLMLLLNVWLSFRYLEIPIVIVVAETIMLLGLVTTEQLVGMTAKAESLRWRDAGLVYSTWSPYRRIDVVESADSLVVFTDGLPFHAYEKGAGAHTDDPRAIPVMLIPRDTGETRNILIIGAGTGSDVRIVRDLYPNELDVVAVEIDEGFIETARTIEWLWEYYRTAEIIVQEGRYYLEGGEEQFDVVIYAYVDPQSAISKIGLPDANFLYTDAGIRSAYGRVKDGGILAITRVFLVQQEDEFVKRLCATLTAAGIAWTQTSLYRHRDSIRWGQYGNLATVHAFVSKGGDPPTVEDTRLRALQCTEGGRATTDLFPFSMVTTVWFDSLADYIRGQPIAIVLLLVLGAALARRLGTSVGHLNFFLLGFGSFLVESLVLFNSFLLIGNPTLSAALAVGFFLVWNSVGSRYSEHMQRARKFYALTPVLVLIYTASAPLLTVQMIAMPMWLRTLIFAVHLSVAGIVVGAMFPISLRIFRGERVASMFFIDLIGCAIAPLAFWLALSAYGVSLVAALCVASYVVVGGILWQRTR